MKRLLLHACCASCATAVIENLKYEYDITIYFYNPNIMPYAEYKRRLDDIKKLSARLEIDLIEGDHDIFLWSELTEGYEKEPEGGKRCDVCFRMRLKETFYKMRNKGFDLFATTLSISPHKNSQIINAIGQAVSNEHFLAKDFSHLYQKSVELSKQHGLYRQSYCGCLFSMR